MLTRHLHPELLDELSADDPRAIHARRDLQKVNGLMGHARIMVRAVREAFPDRAPQLIVELGAGDSTFLLRVARRLDRERRKGTPLDGTSSPRWEPVALLVDRRPALSSRNRNDFDALGWKVETIEADVFEWLQRQNPQTADVTMANLFLHHFSERELASLLHDAASQTLWFMACEPLRARAALAGAAMLRFIGCNNVTLHDAKISVRAGFRDAELSRLWPRDNGWRLTEGRAGPFTHSFVAQGHERWTSLCAHSSIIPVS
jgi:hypothetical protein